MVAVYMFPASPYGVPLGGLQLWFLIVSVLAMLCISERLTRAAIFALGVAVFILPAIFYQCQWWDFWCF